MIRQFTGGPFAENRYLLHCPRTREAVIVDPGGGADEMVRAVLTDELDVRAIALTHAHIDHVDGIPRTREAVDAPILLHRNDLQLYGQAPLQASWFGVELEPLPPVDGYLEEGTTLTFGDFAFEISHTPGHAPGHVILVGHGMCLVGDCVFLGSIGRTDLPGGDLNALMNSIRRRILTLPDETTLYPGHGPFTTVGHERTANPFLAPQFGGSRFA